MVIESEPPGQGFYVHMGAHRVCGRVLSDDPPFAPPTMHLPLAESPP